MRHAKIVANFCAIVQLAKENTNREKERPTDTMTEYYIHNICIRQGTMTVAEKY